MTMTNKNTTIEKQGILAVENLHVSVAGKEIIKSVSLTFEPGKVYVIMGPNGAGKSTLANALMGNPQYTITSGAITLRGEEITSLPVDMRAKRGLFLSLQYPTEIPGIKMSHFLRTIVNNVRGEGQKLSVLEFQKLLEDKMKQLQIDSSFVKRYLNEGFSGGEKKKSEMLQLMLLQPTFALLDETDSGLDVDGIKIVAEGLNCARRENPEMCIIVITHYIKFLDYLKPDYVYVMQNGKIVISGTASLAQEIEQNGFTKLLEKNKV